MHEYVTAPCQVVDSQGTSTLSSLEWLLQFSHGNALRRRVGSVGTIIPDRRQAVFSPRQGRAPVRAATERTSVELAWPRELVPYDPRAAHA